MKFRFCGDLDCPDWVLAEISTISKMSSVRLKVLVVQIISFCLTGTFNYQKILKLAGDNADGVADIKGAIAALHFMVTNAAKYDVDDKSFIQEIQQLGLPKENSDAIAKQYRETKDMMRTQFAEDSYRVSKLKKVDWRVDHIVASSSSVAAASSVPVEDKTVAAVETGPLVHVQFAVDTLPQNGSLPENATAQYTSNRIDKIAFELSSAKLDVLIHELSQAHKLLENMDN